MLQLLQSLRGTADTLQNEKSHLVDYIQVRERHTLPFLALPAATLPKTDAFACGAPESHGEAIGGPARARYEETLHLHSLSLCFHLLKPLPFPAFPPSKAWAFLLSEECQTQLKDAEGRADDLALVSRSQSMQQI